MRVQILAIIVAISLAQPSPLIVAESAPQTTPSAAAWSPKAARQKLAVDHLDMALIDAERDRSVPVRVWYPREAKGACPVVVFSHGLGGSRTGYEYFGKFLAENGFVSIHPQHLGSDESVWRGKKQPMEEMRKAAKDLDEVWARPKDVSFVLDEATKWNATQTVLNGRLDLSRVAVAGHSFGAYTALASSGRRLVAPGGVRVVDESDPRIKACIAMSAPAKAREATNGSYDNFTTPCLHMTGTLDTSPIGDTSAADRRIPFDAIKGADQYLITFTGGDHMIFSGRGRAKARELRLGSPSGNEAQDAQFQESIKNSSLGFLRAYLMDDSAAKAWLRQGLGVDLGPLGVAEHRP